MHLLQSGVSLDMIRDFLGHVDAKTTQILRDGKSGDEAKRTGKNQ
jgi:site-specific recombinase XerD